MKLPTFKQHRRFCEVDSWQEAAAKPGKKLGNHRRYTKRLPDGRVLYTRISHGSGEYRSRDTWGHILRDQLEVTEEEFWAAVDQGIAPNRGVQEIQPPPGEPKPLWLVKNLRELVGLPEREIGAMTPDEARNTWDEWCMRPRPEDTD
ncbi:MAG: cytotoxic translational repressor of toxin-antitoxin stability system [Actinomycetota bacterium]